MGKSRSASGTAYKKLKSLFAGSNKKEKNWQNKSIKSAQRKSKK